MQPKNLAWLAITGLTFVGGMATGIHLWERGKPAQVSPLGVDFCSLATNQAYLIGAKIQTKSEMVLGLEGGVLESDACPDYMLVFKGPDNGTNDLCWQRIISDYNHNGASTDFLVTVQGVVWGKRRSILDFQRHESNPKNSANRPPRVTVAIEHILDCAKK